MFRDIQIVIITNFVVVSSVGIKRIDCTHKYGAAPFEFGIFLSFGTIGPMHYM